MPTAVALVLALFASSVAVPTTQAPVPTSSKTVPKVNLVPQKPGRIVVEFSKERNTKLLKVTSKVSSMPSGELWMQAEFQGIGGRVTIGPLGSQSPTVHNRTDKNISLFIRMNGEMSATKLARLNALLDHCIGFADTALDDHHALAMYFTVSPEAFKAAKAEIAGSPAELLMLTIDATQAQEFACSN